MVVLIQSWECLEKDCDAKGEGPTSDRDAERHTKQTLHGTRSSGRPA